METVQMSREEIAARTGRGRAHHVHLDHAARPGPCLHAHVKTFEAVDPHALEVFKTKMGLRFDAGPEA